MAAALVPRLGKPKPRSKEKAMAKWEQVEGRNVVRTDYDGGRYATVSTEASDWLGEEVFKWKVWAVLEGGRLDGTNYVIGQTVIGQGNAETVEDAMRQCDAFVGV